MGVHYGIEDMKDGKPASQHFMPDKQTHRFKCWVGGGGIGDSDTIEAARERVYLHAKSRLEKLVGELANRLNKAQAALIKLGDEPAKLFRFEV